MHSAMFIVHGRGELGTAQPQLIIFISANSFINWQKTYFKKVDPVGHLGPPTSHFRFCRQWGVAGSGVLQAVNEPWRREAGNYVKVLAKR